MADFTVTTRFSNYPHSEEYDYLTYLSRLNLDEARIKDVETGNGFIISAPIAIKNDVKDPNGIYSQKFGQTLQDIDPFADRYKCDCGSMKGRLNNGLPCPICGTNVKYRGDNFSFFGWIVLKDPYHVIHPALYMSLACFIGEKTFINIITPVDKKDEDGNDLETKKPKGEPFFGIGMLGLYEEFNQIIEFYRAKNSGKEKYYTDLMENINNIFTQSIPVYTTHLRPYRLDGNEFHFEGTNATYNMINKFAALINDDKYEINKKRKTKNQLLFDMQVKIMKLYDEIIKILSGKKGTIRSLFGGRYNFSARSVITPPSQGLRIDEVKLSYQALAMLLQQVIINILHKSYNKLYNVAYKELYESLDKPSPIIRNIIDGIIRDSGRGIPILINRNPTISYGGILQMYCVGICEGFTMEIPLEVLGGLAADFDGDALNILMIINKDFQRAAEYAFNPRNALYISKNDGMFNNDYNHQRDTLINTNTFVRLGRENYTAKELAAIHNALSSRPV